jgi:hypothetical protein
VTTTTARTGQHCRCGEAIRPHPDHSSAWEDRTGGMSCENGSLHAPACTPSSVVDLIVTWPDVQEGDLVLRDGELCQVDRVNPMDFGNPAIVLDGDQHNGTIPAGTYAAVKRYQTGEG